MPGEAGDYLYAAINQTRFVFAKVMKGVSPYDAADFLEDLRKNVPIRLMQTPATCRVRPRAGINVGIGRRLNPASPGGVCVNRIGTKRTTHVKSRTNNQSVQEGAFHAGAGHGCILGNNVRRMPEKIWRRDRSDHFDYKRVVQIERSLKFCSAEIQRTKSIQSARKQLTGKETDQLGWSEVATSKTRHFLARRYFKWVN